MSSKLDFEEEVEKYEAHQEVSTLKFGSCSHKDVTLIDGMVKCSCGMGWSGHGVQELYNHLKNQD